MITTRPTRRWMPAWLFAALYAVVLLCIPTRLVVGPLGAAGSPASLLGIALLTWWICALLGGLIPVQGLTPMRAAVAMFVAAVLASYAAGQFQGWSQPADIHQRSDRLWQPANVSQVTETISSAADRGLLALAGWVGIMLVTAEGVRTWRELEKLLGWVVGAGAVVAGMGVVQYATGLNVASYLRIPGLQRLIAFGDVLSRSELNRIVVTSSHPIELGVVMAALLPLALHRSLHAGRILPWVFTVVIGMASLMSVSRSAVVVAGVGLVVLFVGWPWKWRFIAVGSVPVLAVVGRVVLPGLLGSIRSLFTGLVSDPSITGRTMDYPLVLRLVEERPLFGQGLFTFVPMVYRTIDNQALVLLLELGIVGTAAFVLLILTGQAMAWRARRVTADPTHRHLALAVSASLAGIVTSFVTFDALGFRQVAGLTFLFLGFSGAVWRLARSADLNAGTLSGSAHGHASPQAMPAVGQQG